MNRPRFRGWLYAIFALSGFAGLIYESIWTHYLKLFLGHAAYAQTLVLAIFMGGMAIGAWLAGERSKRWHRPLLAYAVIEAILGVMALSFDPVFRGLQAWFLDAAVPRLETPVLIETLKWTLGALVILPQSILLGATFPLMSAGILRLAHDMPGRVLSWLYFTNSAGAAVGVLVSGFVLIAAVGLPGAIFTAGLVNFALVFALWLLLRGGQDVAPAAQPEPMPPPSPGSPGAGAGVFLAAAFLTGAASFFYEIGWIRMLSLVLGSATHSFEFMLSAFILGLALGGFLLRRRVDRLAEPLRFLGVVQVAMATLALLTLVLYDATFDWMEALFATVQRNDGGYVLFNLVSHAICLALMLPVTICAGMTLPLITRLLLLRGAGEAAIGRVYAANTLGSIAGVLAAVHVVMPWLGLRQVIVTGAAVDFALGLWLLWLARGSVSAAGRWAVGATAAVAATVVLTVHFDATKLASGVFRLGLARTDAEVIFHRDGKTASVSVLETAEQRAIATNGKVDAALNLAPNASDDDITMVGLGALPTLIHPDLRRVAVIGFGAGRTTHTLLQTRRIETVDTIEIEPAMVEGARTFGAFVSAAYEDPRSRVHFEDAKTYFARGGQQYDAIVSEPSNPWVSGVASLFSREFYHRARQHLAPDGVLVQWLQLYEFDATLLASILQALGTEFADYTVYLLDPLDAVVVASPSGPVPEPAWPPDPGLADMLRYVRLESLEDVRALRVGGRQQLEPWLATFHVPANSDYFPYVDQHATRHRFLRSSVTELHAIRSVAARLDVDRRRVGDVAPAVAALAAEDAHDAGVVAGVLGYGSAALSATPSDALAEALLAVEVLSQRCEASVQQAWLRRFQGVMARLLPWLPGGAGALLARRLRSSPCYASAPPAVRQWIDFIEADARSEWARVRDIGLALLAEREWTDPVTQFLVAEVLLAYLNLQDLHSAAAFRTQLQRYPHPSTSVAFLMSQIDARSRAGR